MNSPKKPKNSCKKNSKSECFIDGLVVPNSKKIKTNNSEANFDIELKNKNESEIVESDMDLEYFEDSPKDGDSSIYDYWKLTVVESTASKVNEIITNKNEIIPPKQIMVKNISHAEDFADQLERDCDTDFL